ncbi:Os05g0561000, partial [Oryza sativa Japonica Group]
LEGVADVDEEGIGVGGHGDPAGRGGVVSAEEDLEARGAVGPEHGDDLWVRVLPEARHAALVPVAARREEARRVVVHPQHLVAALAPHHHPPQHAPPLLRRPQPQPLRHQLHHPAPHPPHRPRVRLHRRPQRRRQRRAAGRGGAGREEEVLQPPHVAVRPDALAAVAEGPGGAGHVELLLVREREERHGARLQRVGEPRGDAVVGRLEEPQGAARVGHRRRRARCRQVDARDDSLRPGIGALGAPHQRDVLDGARR